VGFPRIADADWLPHHYQMNYRCRSCGRPMVEDNFFSQCWRCSIADVHPLAPFVWFGLFAVVLFLILWAQAYVCFRPKADIGRAG
jgi:hypothetical protein